MVAKSKFKIGEEVAIAQRYIDLAQNDEFYRLCGIHGMPLELIKYEKGCDNKMFVKADLMPHRIRITYIRVELLQNICEEDCLAEGIVDFESRINKAHFYSITDESATYETAKSHTPCSLIRSQEKAHGTETHSFLFTSSNLSNSRAMEERKYKLQQAASGMQDTQGSTWINAWNQYGEASLSEVPGRK